MTGARSACMCFECPSLSHCAAPTASLSHTCSQAAAGNPATGDWPPPSVQPKETKPILYNISNTLPSTRSYPQAFCSQKPVPLSGDPNSTALSVMVNSTRSSWTILRCWSSFTVTSADDTSLTILSAPGNSWNTRAQKDRQQAWVRASQGGACRCNCACSQAVAVLLTV